MAFIDSVRTGLFVGALGLCGCATDINSENQAPVSLDELVVPSADFTFATSRAVTLQLDSSDGPVAVEVRDSENRRLMQGAFRESVSIDLRLPVGMPSKLTVRTGLGEDAAEQTVQLDDAGHGIAEF